MTISSVNTWNFRDSLTKTQLTQLDQNISNRVDKRSGNIDTIKSEITLEQGGVLQVDGSLNIIPESVEIQDGYLKIAATLSGDNSPILISTSQDFNAITNVANKEDFLIVRTLKSNTITVSNNIGTIQSLKCFSETNNASPNSVENSFFSAETLASDVLYYVSDDNIYFLSENPPLEEIDVYQRLNINQFINSYTWSYQNNPGDFWDTSALDNTTSDDNIGYAAFGGLANPLKFDITANSVIKVNFSGQLLNNYLGCLFCLAYRIDGSSWNLLKQSVLRAETTAGPKKTGVAVFSTNQTGEYEIGIWSGGRLDLNLDHPAFTQVYNANINVEVMKNANLEII